MIVGIGIDQVQVARMSALLRRWPDRARERLFTDEERLRCDARTDAAECYAVRFAAKEAFLKALGSGLGRGIRWREVETTSESDGRPRLRLSGTAARRLRQAGGGAVHMSCTHDAGVAAAVVILEG